MKDFMTAIERDRKLICLTRCSIMNQAPDLQGDAYFLIWLLQPQQEGKVNEMSSKSHSY